MISASIWNTRIRKSRCCGMDRCWVMERWLVKMTAEQKIMCAVVQVDMFLVDCWKWILVILVLFGVFIIIYIHSGRY